MAAGALAVVLDFVQPVGAGRDRSSCRWQAKFQRKRHVEKDRCCLRKIRIPHQNGPGVGSAEAANPTEGGLCWWGNQSSNGRSKRS
jgi:hypothetical protein